MPEQKIYEGRSELNVKPFLDSLLKMETQSTATAANLTKIFQSLDQALDQSLSGIRATVQSAAAGATAIGRTIATLNGAFEKGNRVVEQAQVQAQAAQKAGGDNARARQLEAQANKLGNQAELDQLKRSLAERERITKENAAKQINAVRDTNEVNNTNIRTFYAQQANLLRAAIAEQQAIRDRSNRQLASVARAQADSSRTGTGNVGVPSADALNRASLAAQKAALTEQSLQKQLTSVTRVESAARTQLFETSYQKMGEAQLSFLKQSGTFSQKLGANLENARRELKKVEDQMNSIYRAGSQLMQLGAQFTVFAGVLSHLGLSLSQNAGDFDFWATRVSAAASAAQVKSGDALDTTLIKVEEFRRRSLEIGEDVGILKPAEIAQGWYLYQAALGTVIRSTEDLEGHQANVNALFRASAITDTNFQTVARGTTQAMAEFNLEVSQLPYALAVMNNTTQISQAELSDMLEAFKMVGPQAHRMGLSIGDVSAAFARLSDQGIKGSQAGRLLSSGLTNLIAPTNAMKDALQDMFVTQRNLTGSWEQFLFKGGQFVGLFDTISEKGEVVSQGALRQFHEATKNMTAAQREFYLATIFGKNAGKVWSTLIADYSKAQTEAEAAGEKGVNSFEALAQSMNDPQKQLAVFTEQWKTASDSIKIRLGQALFLFEELKQQLGLIIAQNLIPLIHWLGQAAKGFIAWAQAHPEVASGLVKVAIALVAIAAVVGPFLLVLGFLIQTVAAAPLALAALKTSLGAVSTVFGTLRGVIAGFMPALFGINAPILLLVALLAVLFLAWHNNWFGMRDVLSEVFGAIGGELAALGKLLSGVLTLLAGLFTGKSELIRQGGYEIATALLEGLIAIPVKLGQVLGRTINLVSNWASQLGLNMRVWGHNMIVALANGMIDAGRYVVSIANQIAEYIARPFRSHSPPQFGPLKDIDTWGRNIVRSLVDGMQSADFSAIFEVADQVSEALKRNIEAGLSSPTTFAASMSNATGLIQQMLETVRGGGRVNEDFFSSLQTGLGEWYGYITKIALAYQDVYANKRQLDIEKEKLEVLKGQREELDAQHGLRQDAFDLLLKGTEDGDVSNNEKDMVDPTSAAGQAKISQMRKSLTTEEFQNWLQWQQKMWQDKAAAEDKSLAAQEKAQQSVVDNYTAQVEAAQKQYELYTKMYEYAVRLFNLAEEQKQLEEAAAKDQTKVAANTTGTPADVAAFLAEIAKSIGGDSAILDEGTLRDRAGGDDLRAVGDASRQAEREENRLSDLEKLNRRKRAEFEMALINATSDEERNRIKQQKDSWDAAYQQERTRLQERASLAREVLEAQEKLADATKAGREAADEAKFHQQIVDLIGEQTGAIQDANGIKAEGGTLDDAAIRAKDQLRTEERKLQDLQAFGDQKKLEFEQRIREAADDPEKLRRIKEEQEAWDTAFKKALEAQQLRVELSRRAQQDIGDEASALDQSKAAGADGFNAPDFGAGPSVEDAAIDTPPWMNPDGSINWGALGLDAGSSAGPRASEVQAVKMFDNLRKAIDFLSDASIPANQRIKALAEVVKEWWFDQAGWKGWGDILWAGAGDDISKFWTGLEQDWARFKVGFGSSFSTFWEWTVKPAWQGFMDWLTGLFGGWFTGEEKNWGISLGMISLLNSGWWQEQVLGWGTWFGDISTKVGTWWEETKTGWGTYFTDVGSNATLWWEGQKKDWGLYFSDVTTQATTWWTDQKKDWGLYFGDIATKATTWWTDQKRDWGTYFTDISTKATAWWADQKRDWATYFSDISGKVVGFFTGEDGIVTRFTSGFDDIIGKVVDFFTGPNGIVTKWDSFWGSIKDDWSTLVGGINDVLNPIIRFVELLSNLRFPSVPDWLNGGGEGEGAGSGAGGGGGSAQGLAQVPFNGFRAVLHAGERVLTAREAAFYNSLEGAMSAMGAALSRVQAAGGGGGGPSKVVIINVANIDATNPDEGVAFLNRLAFLG